MVSNLGKEDYEALKAKGVELGYEDIIRINSLALKAEMNQHAWKESNLRRCAFLPGVGVFQEPTIGHDLWFEYIQKQHDDNTILFLIRAWSLSIDQDKLPRWDEEEEILKQLQDFSIKVQNVPSRVLLQVMEYVSNGNCDVDGEFPDINDKELEEYDKWKSTIDQDLHSATVGMILDAQSLNLGIPLDDLKSMTSYELQEVKDAAKARIGFDTKNRKNRAMGQYLATIHNYNKLAKSNNTKENN